MIDIHCHILPGVDDGADTPDTSLMMAAMAVDDHERALIATPHLMWDRNFSNETIAKIQKVYAEFCESLKKANLPIVCRLGAEVLCAEVGEVMIRRGLFPRIAGTSFSLVEFYFDESPAKMNACLREISASGITPVVAHPERYSALQKQKKLLEQWSEQGYYLQVNKGSIYGQFGKKAKKTAEWMLENRVADLWATDAHNVNGRTTRSAAAIKDLKARYGEDYTKLITDINPYLLLQNKKLKSIR